MCNHQRKQMSQAQRITADEKEIEDSLKFAYKNKLRKEGQNALFKNI